MYMKKKDSMATNNRSTVFHGGFKISNNLRHFLNVFCSSIQYTVKLVLIVIAN